jgi:hypothetical protein
VAVLVRPSYRVARGGTSCGRCAECVSGIDGIRSVVDGVATEEAFQAEFQELRDVGDDRVLQLGHIQWSGSASGVEVESPLGQVVTVRDGKIVQTVDYLSHKQALEAVGLH